MVAPISSNRTAALTAASRTTMPTVREGSNGPAVRELQTLLKSKGFNPGPVDGAFGPKTKAAVQAFQRAQGIAVDGVVGPQTWGKLKGASGPAPSPSPTPGPAAKGTAEDFVQKALAQRGDRYVFGAETNLNDKNPDTFDCSELVQWAAHQAGVTVPDGTMNQVPFFRQKGTGDLRGPGAEDARRAALPAGPRGHQPGRRAHHRGARLGLRREHLQRAGPRLDLWRAHPGAEVLIRPLLPR